MSYVILYYSIVTTNKILVLLKLTSFYKDQLS